MSKARSSKIVYSIIFSLVLLASTFYFINSTLLLGASISTGTNDIVPPAYNASGVVSPPATVITPSDQQGIANSVVADDMSDLQAEQAVNRTNRENILKDVYVVKAGQTLWEIAQENGLSLVKLMNDNQLRNSFIVEGQELSYNK